MSIQDYCYVSGSMDDLLGLVEPQLSQLAAGARQRLQPLTTQLPALSGAILEYHAATGRIDFALRVLDSEQAWLAEGLPAHFLAHDAWQRIHKFVQQWEFPPLVHNVNTVYLEFDVYGPLLAVPVPFFFFRTIVLARHDWILDSALPLLSDLAPAARDSLRLTLDGIPETLQYIGIPFSRDPAVIRQTACLPLVDIAPYLEQLEWTGDLAAVCSLLDDLPEFEGHTVLHTDIRSQVEPYFALELHPAEGSEGEVLDYLVRRGLCSTAQREAVQAWPGIRAATDLPEWLAANRPNRGKFGIIIRRLNHVKLTIRPGAALEAKIYLYVGYAWSDRGAAQ